jgi:hypothetical protein
VSVSVRAQTTGIREVSASARSLITLQTRLRYTTMIVLPEGEELRARFVAEPNDGGGNTVERGAGHEADKDGGCGM